MNTIILNIPIEPLEERYSTQWDKWFTDEFLLSNVPLGYNTIYGKKTSGKINKGSFLDVIETNQYKNDQLRQILNYLKTYDDSYKLVIFFHDLWFPGLEIIAYIRDGLGLKNLHICGCLHAGSYDEFDFLNKQGMTSWAMFMELGWFNHVVDKIFVATEYHKRVLCDKRVTNPDQIVVTGFPIYDEFKKPSNRDLSQKIPVVVFPHRLDSEKNPQLFDELKKFNDDICYIKTKDICKTKQEYYNILNSADIAVSFADQETWGIAMQEALICGCFVVCPNRLSYKEMYHEKFLYNTFEQCVNLVDDILANTKKFEEQRNTDRLKILENGREAIPNMIKEMQKL